MSISIGSAPQLIPSPALAGIGEAVMAKSLDLVRQQGAEAVDLIKSATEGSSSSGSLSVYA